MLCIAWWSDGHKRQRWAYDHYHKQVDPPNGIGSLRIEVLGGSPLVSRQPSDPADGAWSKVQDHFLHENGLLN